jgi:hypothetical protein
MGASEYKSVRNQAVKPIHKRGQRWSGYAFGSPEEVADFIGDVGELLEDKAADPPGITTIGTVDREYRDLEPDDLRALSLPPMELIQALSIQAQANHEEPVTIALLLSHDEHHQQTELTVEGRSRVAVDGIAVGIGALLDERFRRLEDERQIAEAEAEHGSQAGEPPMNTWERLLSNPWVIHIGGGTIAAVLAGGILLLLFH